MTRPDSAQAAARSAALSAALSGAVDLSAVKARAEAARTKPPGQPSSGSGSGGAVDAGVPAVFDVTEADFQSDVIDRSMQAMVVVDLWADWCGPCKQLSPVLERLANAANGAWLLAKVDVDANPRIAQLFGVQSIPTVVAIAAGQPIDAFAGALPEPQVRQWIDSLVDALGDRLPGVTVTSSEPSTPADDEQPPVDDPRFVAAERAVERGDFAEAESAYQAILADEPGNERAKSALTRVRFAARTADVDPGVLARADADPGDLDAQLAAADVEVAAGDVTKAFDRLINSVRASSGDDRDRVRKHLVGLFELFDPDDERITTARRNLASALF